jgi:transcription elongation factor Elf1
MATAFSLFRCPNCEARYHLVKVEADPQNKVRAITCRACGGPLSAQEGKYILKYFLLDKRPRTRGRSIG